MGMELYSLFKALLLVILLCKKNILKTLYWLHFGFLFGCCCLFAVFKQKLSDSVYRQGWKTHRGAKQGSSFLNWSSLFNQLTQISCHTSQPPAGLPTCLQNPNSTNKYFWDKFNYFQTVWGLLSRPNTLAQGILFAIRQRLWLECSFCTGRGGWPQLVRQAESVCHEEAERKCNPPTPWKPLGKVICDLAVAASWIMIGVIRVLWLYNSLSRK